MQATGLRYFLAVARTGSIAAASSQLNVAASAISRQIANLEAELDCVLFERRPRGMVPSPAGELLAQHAHQMLIRSEQVIAEIRELEGLARGLIRVASSEGFSLDIVPSAVASFHAAHPGLRFEVTVLPPAQVTQMVAAGEADLGITFALAPTKQVEVLYDGQVDMRVLAAPDHPLAQAKVVQLSELPNYPVALPTRDTTLRQVFEAACLHEGIVVEPVLTANNLSTLLPFVRNSRGLALMSALSVRTPVDLNALISLPIRARASLARGIQIQAMRDRRLPRAVRGFLRQLMDALPPAGVA
ncbi:LysR family transcriptional regulator [Methylobacterium sp. ARG-1]|uniref:LysR family transcriptional regulator n=1 Tax=Methylobacterium sp. ARG-1 TaxID=1692501 RepID=UPI00068026FC|nr:LysR family transcriptional regulator [Methylobacterium sp. ARG-1]KNY20824.1 LysR family transcriptional regulator [Methylobacterium sp. ARG-1]